jgi:hypothetical protein
MKKIYLQICRVGGGRSSPARDSRRWSGSSAAARPRLLGGGTSPEPMVVGEDERWRCRGRASGTSGRTTRTGGRAAGKDGAAREPMSSAVGRHGVGPGGGGPVRGRPGGCRGRDTLAGRLVCGSGASVERERQGQACNIFLVKSRFFRRLP